LDFDCRVNEGSICGTSEEVKSNIQVDHSWVLQAMAYAMYSLQGCWGSEVRRGGGEMSVSAECEMDRVCR
jgi:hypothetical protein